MTIAATLITLIGFVLLLGLVGLAFFYVYWRMVQRPVPDYDNNIQLDVLDASVEILRDKYGIPHIYAESRADIFRAQGFAHAQDRLWQMEQNRRMAQGRLSEIFGAAALDADRFSRIIGFHRAAQAELETLDDETRQALEWYAEGVNAFIETHPGRLAAELNLLRVPPEPWRPVDTLGFTKVMAWSLSTNWVSELTRLQLLHELGPERAAELEPDYAGEVPIILEGVNSQEVQRIQDTAGLLLKQYHELKKWLDMGGEGQGSNSWVLAPKRTLTRRAILCNDPHLTHQIPNTWVENHLTCPDYEVSGASLPGSPFVLIGHNEHIAWGITNSFVDVQDLYLERAHPDNPHAFEFMGEFEDAEVYEEAIYIRRQTEPYIETVVVTRHGPLINGLVEEDALPEGSAPMALKWMAHQPGKSLQSIYQLNQAKNWAEFDTALAGWSTPPQNFVYADEQGHIGYLLAGDVPKRTHHKGLVPVAGWSGQSEWDGLVPHEELPRLFDPESGIIVTANHKMVGDDYPHFLSCEFYPGWRAARIEEMLGEKDRFSLNDMIQIQLDEGSKFAEALTPWFTSIGSDDAWERHALSVMRNWNFQMSVDSSAALVYHFMLRHLTRMVFEEKLGSAADGYMGISNTPLFLINSFHMRAEGKLLELFNEYEASPWYADHQTGEARTREQLLEEALRMAVQDIKRTVGDGFQRWDWGRVHQVRYVHPLGSVRILRNFFNRGPFPIGGDGTTPNQTRYAPKLPMGLAQVTASYRQVYEVGNWEKAQTVSASGQSGHPFSKLYSDQIDMWLEGEYHKMPWGREVVEKEVEFRMTLTCG